jgi:hypothetical protein
MPDARCRDFSEASTAVAKILEELEQGERGLVENLRVV